MIQRLVRKRVLLFAIAAFCIFAFSSCRNQSPPAPPAPPTQPAPPAPPTEPVPPVSPTPAAPSTPVEKPAPQETPTVNPPPTESTPDEEEATTTNTDDQIYEGTATYYSDKFQGKKTASGELYDKDKYTAAVRLNTIAVPYGTMVEVYSVKRKKKVRVRVNDKMSNKASAIIDISYKAAEEIGLNIDGRTKVTVRVISEE